MCLDRQFVGMTSTKQFEENGGSFIFSWCFEMVCFEAKRKIDHERTGKLKFHM